MYPNGGGYSKVGEPLTVEEEYEAVWKRARLDTNELARLRSEGWTVSQVVAHFEYSRTSIKRLLKALAQSWWVTQSKSNQNKHLVIGFCSCRGSYNRKPSFSQALLCC